MQKYLDLGLLSRGYGMSEVIVLKRDDQLVKLTKMFTQCSRKSAKGLVH